MTTDQPEAGMYTAEYSIDVRLSRAQAWDKLQDFSQAVQYVPGLTGLDITTHQKQGVGASRRVYQGDRLALDETVIAWRDGEGLTLRLHRGEKGPMPPMTEAYFDYGLEERDSTVYLHNRMRYRVGLGPLGPLLHKLVLRKAVAAAVRDTTIAQKLYYETGEKVTPEALAEAKQKLRDG